MDIYWETLLNIMRISRKVTVVQPIVIGLLCLLMTGCNSKQSDRREHYFLRGYDELEFRDKNGITVPSDFYIGTIQINGQRSYQIRDTSLTLVNRYTGEPYSGYIRTFHRDRFNLNLQGEFEDGKMFRLRYWHPNRTLGMDADFMHQSWRIWNIGGNIMAESNEDETYYYYPEKDRNLIKEIISDTMRSYFDREGNLERYTKYSDSASIHYYPTGQKRAVFPFRRNGGMNGLVQEWYPNGQLKVQGLYENGEQVGTWVKFDSLGNVEEKIKY